MKLQGYFVAGLLALTQTLTAQSPSSVPLSLEVDARITAGTGFLTRLRLADPDYHTILMACLKENELNVLLSRFVKPEEIPTLVRGLLAELRKDFPGQDLGVIAFRPVVPLHEAGVGRVNGRTGEISYRGMGL